MGLISLREMKYGVLAVGNRPKSQILLQHLRG